jgi:pimeloyl-ACP methyl ester carboxylesterase
MITPEPQCTYSIKNGNGALNYDVVGSGRTSVVLLHGLFGNPDNWRGVMERLAYHYRFFALQLPIDPHQDRRHTAFNSISQLTDHVERFLEVVGLDRPVLCGNSLGGQIALDFCIRHPRRVERLVLAGSAGLFERNLTNGKRLRCCRNMVREQACGIFHDPKHVTDELVEDIYAMLEDRQYRRFLLKVSKATRDRYMLDELAAVDVPTMIIWGRNDSITPPFVAQQFRDRMPRAELAFIEKCGHAPPIEQPHEFARLLHDFLRRIPAPENPCNAR